MDKGKLAEKVQHFRSLGCEGTYWDFKREWHKDRAALLLDIICMANNSANEDAYLIVGVADDTSIIGVEDDPNRQNLNLLSQLLFGNGSRFSVHVPEVDLQTIELENHELDIIVIRNTLNTPYFLLRDYHDKDYERKGGKKPCYLSAGKIYLRNNDGNMGMDCAADHTCIANLWKKRFGLLLPAKERFALLLNDFDKWVHISANKMYYHEDFPDFRLQYEGAIAADWCPPSAFFASPVMHSSRLRLTCGSTTIYETTLWYFDEFRKKLPKARTCSVDSISNFWYWYYDLSSIEGRLLTIFTDGTNCISSREPNYNQLLLFKTPAEKAAFDLYLAQHFNDFSDDYIRKKYRFQIEVESKELGHIPLNSALQVGKAAELYVAWRQETKLINQWEN